MQAQYVPIMQIVLAAVFSRATGITNMTKTVAAMYRINRVNIGKVKGLFRRLPGRGVAAATENRLVKECIILGVYFFFLPSQ